MKLFIKRIISIYVVLFTTSFPIHFDSWLNFPVYIAKFWESINVLVCRLINIELDSPILSDSKGLYIHLLSILVLSAIISFVWGKILKNEDNKRKYYFNVYVSYYLSLQLIIYGLNKVFLLQFPSPTANILFTNIGAISKDLLFWTTMSSSPLYNYFMGGVELLCAGFLLFSKTRLLGAFLSVGIFLNIVFINFSFDISVKVYSLFLLFSSSYLISPYLSLLHRFFIKGEQVKLDVGYPEFINLKYVNVLPLLKVLMISTFLYVGVKPYSNSIKAQGKASNSNGFSEAYKVISYKANGVELNNIDLAWERVYFHPRSYFIIENNQEEFSDYELILSSNSKQLILNHSVLNYQLLANGNIKLFGVWNEKALAVTIEPINHKKLPLLDDQFHWTVD